MVACMIHLSFLSVDDVLAVSFQPGAQVPGGNVHQVLQSLPGRPRNVRCEDSVGFCPQGTFLGQRLGDKGIGPVKAQLTAVESRCHGLLIHQCAPGRVEQNGPGLHLRQRLRVDKAPGLGRGRAVQAEDIAPPQQGIIIHKLHTVSGVFGPDGAGADQHLHAKGSGNAGRLRPMLP